MQAIENRMVVDSEWVDIERECTPKANGYFDRWGGFVHEDYLLEVAFEEIMNNRFLAESFLENIFDYIDGNTEAEQKFLKWFYPNYGGDK